jgi:RecB family exonuclease
VRVADLHALRHAIGLLVRDSPLTSGSGLLVVVPSRSAARQLERTLKEGGIDGTPRIVDRDQLYDDLHARLKTPPPRLGAFERNAIAQASARRAAASMPDLPFRLRPALVAEVLGFYDLLRRQSQRVDRFESLVEEQLAGHADADPGAGRLLQQTRFLAATFREYERRAGEAQAVDEHSLRARLAEELSEDPARHLVVAVSDWIGDPHGLYVADFDLLSRLPGLEAIDLIATDALLASGLHERIHTWLPGLEETSIASPATVRPRLVTPPVTASSPAGAQQDRLWFIHRDREEELIAVARQVGREEDGVVDRVGVVFRRPLPYLYLAGDTLGAAGIPFQAAAALPLAAEPTAAALDLVVDLVESDFSRSALVALLRSPHFQFDIARRDINAIDRALSERGYLGEIARLDAIAAGPLPERVRAPLERALAACRPLAVLTEPRAASTQVQGLAAFVNAHLRPLEGDDPLAGREGRARAVILDGLGRLAQAHAQYDDPPWTIDDLGGAVRRWIEGETFVRDDAGRGVHLLDDDAARFGSFDDLTLVGLVDGEWPERPRRNIFYASNIMKALGWPSEKDRRAAEDARFLDLLSSASRRVTLSTITLDDEMLVEPSTLLDEVPRARLTAVPQEPWDAVRVLPDEALAGGPLESRLLSGPTRDWAAAREERSPADSPVFHGAAGPRPPRSWSISALETYLGCPFRFFARYVLHLEEEPDDEEVMDPRRQGLFMHEIFEHFFREWQAQAGGAITPANLEEARALFAATVDRLVDRLPAAEAGIVRTQLLGSPAAAGLGEAVLRMEAERPVEVVERLLEHELTGPLTIATETGPRVVQIRGKADRLDLLADGTFRVIDYKLGWPPQRTRALQLPIYSLCAEQRLAGTRGRSWTAGEAVYLAFKGPRRVVPLFTSEAERTDVMSRAQARVAETIERIEGGEFPPAPDDVYRCETCSFTAVCRKDYVGDV